MKWFKHETDAIHSEKLTRLQNEFGFEGNGRFWRIMEIVAERMDGSDRCHAELPEKEWLRLLSIRRPLLHRYLDTISSIFDNWQITTDNDKQLIRIEIPNLLEKRDNYTTNLQATDKKLTKRSRSRTDVEVDNIKEGSDKNSDLPPSALLPSDVIQAEKAWVDEFKKQHGRVPDMSPGKDKQILKGLIETHGLEMVLEKIPLHIASAKMQTIVGLKTVFNELGLEHKKASAVRRPKLEQTKESLKRFINRGRDKDIKDAIDISPHQLSNNKGEHH